MKKLLNIFSYFSITMFSCLSLTPNAKVSLNKVYDMKELEEKFEWTTLTVEVADAIERAQGFTNKNEHIDFKIYFLEKAEEKAFKLQDKVEKKIIYLKEQLELCKLNQLGLFSIVGNDSIAKVKKAERVEKAKNKLIDVLKIEEKTAQLLMHTWASTKITNAIKNVSQPELDIENTKDAIFYIDLSISKHDWQQKAIKNTQYKIKELEELFKKELLDEALLKVKLANVALISEQIVIWDAAKHAQLLVTEIIQKMIPLAQKAEERELALREEKYLDNPTAAYLGYSIRKIWTIEDIIGCWQEELNLKEMQIVQKIRDTKISQKAINVNIEEFLLYLNRTEDKVLLHDNNQIAFPTLFQLSTTLVQELFERSIRAAEIQNQSINEEEIKLEWIKKDQQIAKITEKIKVVSEKIEKILKRIYNSVF